MNSASTQHKIYYQNHLEEKKGGAETPPTKKIKPLTVPDDTPDLKFPQEENLFGKMHHSFDIYVAAKYGVDAAILIHHFHHWININKSLKRNCHDGRFWTYQTLEEIAAHFPYWTKSQIQDLIEKLCTGKNRKSTKETLDFAPVLIKGNFNRSRFDRTVWYAFIDEKSLFDSRERMGNPNMVPGKSQSPNPEIPTTIPDTKTYNRTNRDIKSEHPSGLTTHFFEKLKEINPKRKKPNLAKWSQEMKRLIHTDGRTEEEVRSVIEYIIKDHNNPKSGFTWSIAIQGPEKLRKHFDAIWIQMNTKPVPKSEKKMKEEVVQKKLDILDEERSLISANNSWFRDIVTPRIRSKCLEKGIIAMHFASYVSFGDIEGKEESKFQLKDVKFKDLVKKEINRRELL